MTHIIKTYTDSATELKISCNNLSVEHIVNGGCTHSGNKSYSLEKIVLESSTSTFGNINGVLDTKSDRYLEAVEYYSQNLPPYKKPKLVLFFDDNLNVYHLPNCIRTNVSPTSNFERTAEFETTKIEVIDNNIEIPIFLNSQEYNSLLMSLTSKQNTKVDCKLNFEFIGKADDLVIGKDIDIKLFSYSSTEDTPSCIKLKNFQLNIKL